MTRRIVLTIAATVLATLLVAGAATLVLANARGRSTTERDLRDQAEVVAEAVNANLPTANTTDVGQRIIRQVRQSVRGVLRVDGIEFLRLTDTGAIDGVVPDGVSIDDLDRDALLHGITVGGAHGQLVYAAASSRTGPNAVLVAVLTREASPGIGAATRYFAVASIGTLALGILGAVVLGRRIARPLRAASVAASGIADGRLQTRLAEPAPKRRDEIAGLARSLNSMAAALERSHQLDRQFLQSVSHDLRTPLTSIGGYAEAIIDGATDDPARAARVIADESARLARLVDDLLDLARIDARTFRLDLADVDLAGPVANAVASLTPSAQRGRITLSGPPAPDHPVRAHADPQRVTQIVVNLLDNAVRHAHTCVDVEVLVDRGAPVVRVGDDGPGIDPADRAHVFDRLYSSRGAGDIGAGLGLAIVRELAAAMGGQAGVVEHDGGACFEVRFAAVGND